MPYNAMQYGTDPPVFLGGGERGPSTLLEDDRGFEEGR